MCKDAIKKTCTSHSHLNSWKELYLGIHLWKVIMLPLPNKFVYILLKLGFQVL